MTDLAERRSEAESRLASLHQARGRALLAGEPFDHAPVMELEAQIAGMSDAEGEQARRERTAAAEAREKRLQALRVELADEQAAEAKALASAEDAARRMAGALGVVVAHAARSRQIIGELNGATGEHNRIIGEPDLVDGLSRKLAAQIASITGHRGRFGILEFKSSMLPPADRSWTTTKGNSDATSCNEE